MYKGKGQPSTSQYKATQKDRPYDKTFLEEHDIDSGNETGLEEGIPSREINEKRYRKSSEEKLEKKPKKQKLGRIWLKPRLVDRVAANVKKLESEFNVHISISIDENQSGSRAVQVIGSEEDVHNAIFAIEERLIENFDEKQVALEQLNQISKDFRPRKRRYITEIIVRKSVKGPQNVASESTSGSSAAKPTTNTLHQEIIIQKNLSGTKIFISQIKPMTATGSNKIEILSDELLSK